MKTFARMAMVVIILFCLWGLLPAQSAAQVSVSIGVFAPPPPLVVAGPPVMAVIPGTTYVYFSPDVPQDIFFHSGYWYRPHEGRWFRAPSYRGPWTYVDRRLVAPAIVSLPRDYRHIPPGHQKIPYGQLKKNWKRWEKEHYWDERGGGDDKRRRPYERSEARWSHGDHPGKGNGRGKN